MPTVRRTRKRKTPKSAKLLPSPTRTPSQHSHSGNTPTKGCPACALEAAEAEAQRKFKAMPKAIRMFRKSPRSKSEKARAKTLRVMRDPLSSAAESHLYWCDRAGTYEDGTPRHKGCPRAPQGESVAGDRRRRTRKSRKSRKSRKARKGGRRTRRVR